jgi:hypothetical protein
MQASGTGFMFGGGAAAAGRLSAEDNDALKVGRSWSLDDVAAPNRPS